MSKAAGFRYQLQPPQGSKLERSHRPWLTCTVVSGCIAFLICTTFGLTAYNIYQHWFGRTEHKYHAGDEVSLQQAGKDLKPMFCSAYVVQPLGQADFFLLPHKAELDPSKRVSFGFILTASSHRTLFDSSTHYLPENTKVALTACRNVFLGGGKPVVDEPAEFLVIVGDTKFKEWHKHFDSHHAQHRVRIPKNATCEDPNTTLPHLELTTKEPDNYYFILFIYQHPVFLHHDAGDITLTGNITKSLFNLSRVVNRCNATEESCRFPLAWGSNPDVVVEVPENVQDADALASFFTDCEERLLFWVPVFGALPVLLLSLMCLWCWCLLVKRKSVHSWYDRPTSFRAPRTNYGSVEEEEAPLLGEAGQPNVVSEDMDGRASIQD